MERGIEISEIADIIENGLYYDVIDNPARMGQHLAVVPYLNRTCAVPYIIDKDGNIVLKTAYYSRKYHKLYGGNEYE